MQLDAPASPEGPASPSADATTLESVQRRLLWLAVRMVDYANRDRPNPGGIKVGGHQASSASMVSLMTALWFGHLRRNDFVATKPHAAPVLHAINYLLGDLDRRYLTELRAFGGLQAYPSRTKDPDRVDYSTGSVGLGAAAPLFGAVVARYLAAHFDAPDDRRFIALVGDAELDEGNVWEAIADPVAQGLTNVMWVVDLNRQSLDRIVPGVRATRIAEMFRANDWAVVEAKYGATLQALFGEPGGDALRVHLDAMSNERYQSLFALDRPRVRERFLDGADAAVRGLADDLDDDHLYAAVTNLGGHDLAELQRAYDEADRAESCAAVLAYTVKGWGLATAGDRMNHAALLTADQVDRLAADLVIDRSDDWAPFPTGSAEEELCVATAARLHRPPSRPAPVPAVPESSGAAVAVTSSTQETFGRAIVGLSRHPDLMRRIVTTSPDVTVSTNLGGWVNKAGVFAHLPAEAPDSDGMLRWRPQPDGQHLELGISEMNLFLLLGQLGLSGDMFGEPLVPIGTVYDPFVLRGLDALIYAVYTGARFVVAGTPSGVSLSYEGGAHQSVVTPSVGLELPGITYVEPAYGTALDWLFCHAVDRLHAPDGDAVYLRLTTRPIDQTPFEVARQRLGDDVLRRHVLAGGYVLRDADVDPTTPLVHMAACGAVMPEVLAAADALAVEGVEVRVVDVTSPDRLFGQWRSSLRRAISTSTLPAPCAHLDVLIPPGLRSAPLVTVLDGSAHTLAWLGAAVGVATTPLGVESFGQSGPLDETYAYHQLDAGSIVNAALVAVERAR